MPNGSKPQILVVDDEPGVRKSLGMLLLAAGYMTWRRQKTVSVLYRN
jgi:FixJ family two-component response regulator